MSSPLAHAAVALIAKPLVPKAPLWSLLVATQVPDLLSFTFLVTGLEQQAVTQQSFSHGIQYLSPARIPWSHGFLMCIVWSVIVTVITFFFFRDRRVGIATGLMVFIHWILDAIVYSNLPLFLDGSPLIGIGLATSGPGFIIGIIIEFVLIISGIIIYINFRRKVTPLKI